MRGRADQGAGDGAALFLAAGDFVRAAAGDVVEMELLDHFVDAAMAFEARAAFGGELEILAERHVGEQRVVLEDVAAVALLGSEADAGGGVEQDVVVEEDAAGVGADEAGDGVESEGLAGSAGSEQDGGAGARGGFEFEVEGEGGGLGTGGELFADFGANHRPRWNPRGSGLRRFASQRMPMATAEMTSTRTRARWPLPASTAS